MLQRKTFLAAAATLLAMILAGPAHAVWNANYKVSFDDSQQDSGPVTVTFSTTITPTNAKIIEDGWQYEIPAEDRTVQRNYLKLTGIAPWQIDRGYQWDPALISRTSRLRMWSESEYLYKLSYLYYQEEECPYCRFYNMVDDWYGGYISTAQLDALVDELRHDYGDGPWNYSEEYAPYYLEDWTSSIFRPNQYLYGGLRTIAVDDDRWKREDGVRFVSDVPLTRGMVYFNYDGYEQRDNVSLHEGDNSKRLIKWELSRSVFSGKSINSPGTLKDYWLKELSYTNVGGGGGISTSLNYSLSAQYSFRSDVIREPDSSFKAAITPNDPLFLSNGSWSQKYDDQWALHRIGFKPLEDPASAWNLTTGIERPVIVAVIDSGIDLTHPDLHIANIWTNQKETPGNARDDDNNGYIDDLIGWNFVQNNNNPFDLVGHGTHVAGLIAARWNNGRGIAGINRGARIMVLKALDEVGKGWGSDIARAVVYAVDNGARVINISAEHAGQTKFLERAFAYAQEKGALVVVSAGNEAADTKGIEPANQPGVLVVAATLPNDKRVGFSNWGEKVNIAAPGVDVLSLRAHRTDLVRKVATDPSKITPGEAVVGKDEQYYRASGTSFAAPLVTGVASLMLAKNPSLTAEQIKRMLMMSADDIETPGWDQLTGYGMVNARKALEADPDYYLYAELHRVVPAREGGRTVVQVFGTAGGSQFGDYRIEVGQGENPTSWKPAGQAVGGQIKDNLLGTLTQGDFGGSGRWTVRLLAQDKKGLTRESRSSITLQ
jgi:subtilisin family serine protease